MIEGDLNLCSRVRFTNLTLRWSGIVDSMKLPHVGASARPVSSASIFFGSS